MLVDLRSRRRCHAPHRSTARLALIAVAVGAVSAACSGGNRAPVRSAPLQPGRAGPAGPVADGDGVLLPDPSRMWLAGSEPDGTRYIVVDGSRVTLQRDSTVAWGTDRFATGIRIATRAGTGTGWIFVAHDGAIGAADTFLGPLRPLGELPEGQRVMNSQGRLVLLDRARGVFTTDGSAPLARMASMPEGGVLDAAFVSAGFGAVVINGGQMFRTNNGGASWQPVDLGSDAAWRVGAEGSNLVAETTAGRKIVAPDGTLSTAPPRPASAPPPPNAPTVQGNAAPRIAPPPVPPPPPPPPPPHTGGTGGAGASGDEGDARHTPVPAADAAIVRAAMLRRYPTLLSGEVSVTAPDGNLIAMVDGAFVLVDPRSGRVVREIDSAPGEGACRIEPWGNAIGVQCAEAGFTLRYTADGAAPVGRRDTVADVVFSSDGRHAAGLGTCRSAPVSVRPARAGASAGSAVEETAPTRGLCVLADPNGAWRRVPFTGRNPRLHAMHGAQLLVTVARADDDDTGLRVIDVDRGTVRRLNLAGGADPRTIAMRSAEFTPDGRVVGVGTWRLEEPDPEAELEDEGEGEGDDESADAGARREEEPAERPERPRGPVPPSGGLVLLYGTLDQPLALRALPAGAESVGFVDGTRGVAAGADVRQMWRTEDGGQTWRQVPLAVVGPAKAVSFSALRAPGVPAVRCARSGCVVGGRVWFPPERSARSLDGRVVAGRDPRAAVEAPEDDASPSGNGGGVDVSAGRYICAAPASPLPSLLRVTAGLRRNALRRTLVAPGVNAVLDAWAERGTTRLALQWRGTDASGAFSGATAPAEPQLADLASDTTPWRAPSYTLWGAGRGGALLERCAAPSWRACQLVWAAPRGTLTAIADATAFAAGGNVNVESAVPLPGGGFAVLAVAPTTESNAPTVQMLTVIGPDGRVQSRRGFAFLGARLASLGRHRGNLGLAVAAGSNVRAMDFFPVAAAGAPAPVRLPELAGGAMALCGASTQAGPDTLELFTTSPALVPQMTSIGSGLAVSATVELNNGRGCVRAVRAFAPGRRGGTGTVGAPRGVSLTVGTDGRLSGFSDDGSLTSLLQCTRQP